MTRDPIFIRVDATSRSGYERLARCSTLAAALQRRRRPTFFLSELEPPSLAFNLKRGGNDWIGLRTTDDSLLKAVSRVPLFGGFLGLGLLLMAIGAMWYREGR